MNIHILLVDDEAIDLEWLRVRVEATHCQGLRVAGTAKSGFAALACMKQERIDIILSDIRMPIMSGFEFARKAREINPEVRIAFISGHEDFSYAKEALQLEAYDYLLKPVDDGELAKMIAGLCAKVEEDRRHRSTLSEALPYVQRELLLRWFHEASPATAEERLTEFVTPFIEKGTAVALIEADDFERHSKELTIEGRRELWTSVEQHLMEIVQKKGLGNLMIGFANRFVLLTAGGVEIGTKLEELIDAFREAFPFTITVGIGVRAYSPEELHNSYRQAEMALSIKWILGKNRVIRDITSQQPVKTGAVPIERIFEELLQAILDYDLVKIDDGLTAIFRPDFAPHRKSEAYDLIIRMTSKLHGDLQQLNENLYELLNWESHQPDVLFEFETMNDIVSWLRRRLFELSELLFMKRRKQDRKLIADIMSYVEGLLENKVTLKEVAAKFDFTPNYLGHLFKAETGMGFSDFMNTIRMKRACELLDNPWMKVYEIADKIGYKNVIYFNRFFKQATGMTPRDYRKKNKI
ncbi:AraC family transcriptional regulator [Paenibacillus marchantiophytorum]|uniref:AraC family transcriptional regulator n=1 Tax=Paenibacillus marchantiophytorum TaxID=1619310 RepID=A0ABQ1EZ86_9BACL|nr:response regulator [Paenibacillus marchantiophytorum]GFZ93409.1 AraC family transcriptional regulator [Paenibacillus marchantiophytorum]